MLKIIQKSLIEINKDLELEEFYTISSFTPIYELIDSISLLDLILELEANIKLAYNRYIQVADEFSMDDEKTPFKTVGTLEVFLKELIS
jgi:hypothetical protein